MELTIHELLELLKSRSIELKCVYKSKTRIDENTHLVKNVQEVLDEIKKYLLIKE